MTVKAIPSLAKLFNQGRTGIVHDGPIRYCAERLLPDGSVHIAIDRMDLDAPYHLGQFTIRPQAWPALRELIDQMIAQSVKP